MGPRGHSGVPQFQHSFSLCVPPPHHLLPLPFLPSVVNKRLSVTAVLSLSSALMSPSAPRSA